MGIEATVKAYLRHFHGTPTNPITQYDYYRCETCRNLVTWKQIRNGGCKCGTGSRIRAAHLHWYEKAKCLLLPWTV